MSASAKPLISALKEGAQAIEKGLDRLTLPWHRQDNTKPAPRQEPVVEAPLALAAPEAPVQAAAAPVKRKLLPSEAIWGDRLWGPGFLMPGGVTEISRLTGLLPLSASTTLLQIGQDAGGAAATVVGERQTFVSAYQDDAETAERMTTRTKPLGRKVSVLPWDPAAPGFRPRYHGHALALEPFRRCQAPGKLVPAIAGAMKNGGQLVMLDFALGPAALEEPGPVMRRWMELESRVALPMTENALGEALQKAGFTVHVVEDTAPRQSHAVLESWTALVESLKPLPPRGELLALVQEAERWLLRFNLLRDGKLRLLRWHATLSA